MKVFISADIEGIAIAARKEDCSIGGYEYERYRQEMTREVVAACEGAHEAGADLIVVRDAHGPAISIYPEELPEYVELIRNWSTEPRLMVEGVDETFDAAMFVGYHNAAGTGSNVLSHTISMSRVNYIKINGKLASEFLIYSYMCAYYGVPSVLLAGDKGLCEESQSLHPGLVTVPVCEDIGGRSRGISPKLAWKQIREGAKKALSQDLKKLVIEPPKNVEVEIGYKEHALAYTKSFYPGAKLVDPKTISLQAADWYEVGRFLSMVVAQ